MVTRTTISGCAASSWEQALKTIPGHGNTAKMRSNVDARPEASREFEPVNVPPVVHARLVEA
jgi:hypothetical protein